MDQEGEAVQLLCREELCSEIPSQFIPHSRKELYSKLNLVNSYLLILSCLLQCWDWPSGWGNHLGHERPQLKAFSSSKLPVRLLANHLDINTI